jgi:8-oxo-dGTP pyrophosphatase MutT (NUDIX family)
MKTDLTVGAGIILGNKILFVLHAKLGKWLFPGGHIEQNESPNDAIVREVKEETGLDLRFLDYGPISDTPDIIKELAIPFDANLHSVGDHNHYCMYYACTVDSQNFVKSDESKDIRWVDKKGIQSLENLPENVRRMALFLLEKYKDLG